MRKMRDRSITPGVVEQHITRQAPSAFSQPEDHLAETGHVAGDAMAPLARFPSQISNSLFDRATAPTSPRRRQNPRSFGTDPRLAPVTSTVLPSSNPS